VKPPGWITEDTLKAATGWERVRILRAAAQQLHDHPTMAFPTLKARQRAGGFRAAATRLERRLKAEGVKPC
jgi:hypothetical protein